MKTVVDEVRDAKMLPKWYGKQMRRETANLRDVLISKLAELNADTCCPLLYEDHMEKLDDLVRIANSIVRNLTEADRFEIFSSGIGNPRYDTKKETAC